MENRIKRLKSYIINTTLFLELEADDGLYTASLTDQLIRQSFPDINFTVETFRIFLQKLPLPKVNEIIKMNLNELSILLASLAKRREHKAYIKCPLSKVKDIADAPVSQAQMHETCKKLWQANDQRLQELEVENLELKIKVEQLNYKVDQQEEKLKQFWDLVRMEVDQCRQDYKSRIEELSIIISEQKSSQIK